MAEIYQPPGNQSCYFQAKVSQYPDARSAYNDCLGWLFKMRMLHASQLSEFSCSQCFNTHRGTPDDPTYCPAPAVDWTPGGCSSNHFLALYKHLIRECGGSYDILFVQSTPDRDASLASCTKLAGGFSSSRAGACWPV